MTYNYVFFSLEYHEMTHCLLCLFIWYIKKVIEDCTGFFFNFVLKDFNLSSFTTLIF